MSNTETKFKIGDKIRFRQDGEIGDYNKRVYGSDMFVEYSVIITEPDSEKGYTKVRNKDTWHNLPTILFELVPNRVTSLL